MNENFFRLPEEKQIRIINAGFEIFSKYEYKKASTEEIAIKAGISKGLLFHYFHNKKSFYMYLLEYCIKLTNEQFGISHFDQITDFFELFTYSAKIKMGIIKKTPYIMEFSIRSYCSQNEAISEELQKRLGQEYEKVFSTYFSHIDFQPFKDDINPMNIYQMLVWMADGYFREVQRMGKVLEIEDFMAEFNKWKEMFRKISYKEEYLNEAN